MLKVEPTDLRGRVDTTRSSLNVHEAEKLASSISRQTFLLLQPTYIGSHATYHLSWLAVCLITGKDRNCRR